jgi:DMSO/TMAO reductase YedYZ molybdopterin-dependent catalytic subunit
MTPPLFTRRSFLEAALLAPVFARQVPSARRLGTVPLGVTGGGRTPPFGRLLGPGLDARLFTDLSALNADRPETLVTATDKFFVRTAAPDALRGEGWNIRIDGLVASPLELDLSALESMAERGGRYLIECSGNVDQSNYGLMSTADWDGVPLTKVLDRVRPTAPPHRVLVSGLDHEASPARTSVPGASWIFARADLDRAILATRMNRAPLPTDHGAPVRLIVPGWYGCACIKWVNRIELVADDAPATAQMREFAARTHQLFDPSTLREPQGRPEPSRGATGSGSPRAQSRGDSPRQESSPRARDFVPAVIDTAAMPIRVEKWAEGGRVFYRVVGIVWGGSKPTNALSIRFKSGTPWVRVEQCPLPESTLTWSLWSHTWRPESAGRYQIVLKVDDPSIRTRRLDVFFYVREIDIEGI